MNTIGERLKFLLKQSNIKTPELAKRIGVSKGTIYNIINNTTLPKQDTIAHIAKELDTSIDYLVFGTEEYKDLIEEQLLETFRKLNHENKVSAVGEIMKLLTMQELNEKKD